MSPAQTIAQLMQANADHAVRYAREHYRSELDFSPASLERVDKIIDIQHVELPKSFLARALMRSSIEAEVWTMAKMWGAYVGETFRRQWGGRWKAARREDGHVDVALELPSARCEVVERVRWRLAEGAGERLEELFASMHRLHRTGTDPHATPPPV